MVSFKISYLASKSGPAVDSAVPHFIIIVAVVHLCDCRAKTVKSTRVNAVGLPTVCRSSNHVSEMDFRIPYEVSFPSVARSSWFKKTLNTQILWRDACSDFFRSHE